MYPRIATRLLAEPWLIHDAKYDALIQQFRTAVVSRKTLRTAAGLPEDDDDILPQAEADDIDDIEIDSGIAIVPVHGILGKHLSMLETMCGGYDLDVLNRQCIALMHRTDVTTAIFHFVTPGGAAAGVADSAAVIEQLGTMKRTIAYCDEACSGGQWLAAACHEIVCGESAMMGSISALCALVDESKAWAMQGLEMNLFTDGPLKGIGVPGSSLTKEQASYMQERVQEIGGKFKDYIRARRPGVSDDAMRGQPLYGDKALAAGLADALAPTLQHCIAAALSV